MGNREERNEYATAKWDAEEVRRQASSEQRRHSDRRRQAKRAFAADGGAFDASAVLHQGQQGDDPVVREVDDVDPVARLIQDPAALKIDMGKVRCDQPVVFGGKRGE